VQDQCISCKHYENILASRTQCSYSSKSDGYCHVVQHYIILGAQKPCEYIPSFVIRLAERIIFPPAIHPRNVNNIHKRVRPTPSPSSCNCNYSHRPPVLSVRRISSIMISRLMLNLRDPALAPSTWPAPEGTSSARGGRHSRVYASTVIDDWGPRFSHASL
jgi:hypothetical protein